MPKDESPEYRLRVDVDQEESGSYPAFPPASLLGTKTAPDGSRYYLVVLDRPVTCKRYTTDGNWTIQYLLVKAKFQGEDMVDIFKGTRDSVPVGIGNVINLGILDSPTFEWNDVEYFAVGYVRPVEH